MVKVRKQTARRKTKRATKATRVMTKVSPIGFEKDQGISINIFGRSGSGKTTLWSTFPGKIIVMLASGGRNTGELRSIDTAANRKKIDQVVLAESVELVDVCKHVQRKGGYQTVVLEHATGLQELVLKEILGIDEIPAQMSWGIAKREQWGQCTLQMKELLRQLLDLMCNVVVVAQEREFKSDDDEEEALLLPRVGSALAPSVTGWVNYSCDYVVQTFVRAKRNKKVIKVGKKKVERLVKGAGVEYCVRVGPSEVYMTKFRNPRTDKPMEEVMVDGSYQKIMKLIQRK